MTGDFLPLQLIYEGKTEQCLPQYKFPTLWHVIQSESHWSNKITMKQHIEKVILPYVNRKRKELQLPNDQPALLIIITFKDNFLLLVIVLLPANCTDGL